MKQIWEILKEDRFDFVSREDKEFIESFDREIMKLGYDGGGKIGKGFCWGKYMIIYSKTGVKSKKVAARIYIREGDSVLRLFFCGIEKHGTYISEAPDHVRDVFMGERGDCRHCHNKKKGKCQFRKSYILEGKEFEKCNGEIFKFNNPSLEKLKDYIGLFKEFYLLP